MKKILITQATIIAAGVFAAEGDKLELADDVADTLISVNSAVLDDDQGGDENRSDVLLLSIAKAGAIINEIDDADELQALLDEEEAGIPRRGMLALISERIAELSVDDAQDGDENQDDDAQDGDENQDDDAQDGDENQDDDAQGGGI